jgi:hypothetical protein
MQRDGPRLITNDAIRGSPAPCLKRLNRRFGIWAEVAVDSTCALVFGPKLPSIPPGDVFHWPDAPLERTCCRLRTTAPVEPSLSVGMGAPLGRAAQVSSPTTPSTAKPAPCWNSLTAVSVAGKLPSTITALIFGPEHHCQIGRFLRQPIRFRGRISSECPLFFATFLTRVRHSNLPLSGGDAI